MKKQIKNFNKLSAKQIKTYAAVIFMSLLSFNTLASVNEEEAMSEAGLATTVEASFEEELIVENWMLTPFDTESNMDLVVESWMLTPFDINIDTESPVNTSTCSPAP